MVRRVGAAEGALVLGDPATGRADHVAVGHEHVVELHAAGDGGAHAQHLPVVEQLHAVPVDVNHGEHHAAGIGGVALDGAPHHEVLRRCSHRGEALAGRQAVAALHPGEFRLEDLGTVLVEVGLGAQRGAEGTVGDDRKQVVALLRRRVVGDDPRGVVVDLQQLGGVGLPAGHALQHPVPGAEPAGQPVAGAAVLAGQAQGVQAGSPGLSEVLVGELDGLVQRPGPFAPPGAEGVDPGQDLVDLGELGPRNGGLGPGLGQGGHGFTSPVGWAPQAQNRSMVRCSTSAHRTNWWGSMDSSGR